MQSPKDMKEKRKHTRHSITLILEYWDTYNSLHGGLIGNVSKTGLLIYSLKDLPIGSELTVQVFFSNGYKLDSFQVFSRVIWKQIHREKGWQGYKCGLEFIQVSQHDLQKLLMVLDKHSQTNDPCRYLLRRFKRYEYRDELATVLGEPEKSTQSY